MTIKRYCAIAASIALTAGLLVAMPAQAANGQKAQATAQQSAAKTSHFSDAQVQKYVKARKKVDSIASKWKQKIQNAKDKKAAFKLRKKANQKMVQAVKSTGLSVSAYNGIARKASNNKTLAKRIEQAR